MKISSTNPAARWLVYPLVAWSFSQFIFRQSVADDSVRSMDTRKSEFFEARIRPVLIEHCYGCHNSAETAEGGLALDHRDGLLRGGDGGVILRPGAADKSRLLAILRHDIDGLEMPQGGPKLDDSVIADFERWIADGAYDPRDEAPDADQLASMQSWETLLERRKTWWSFQQIVDHQPPTDGIRDDLDSPNLHPIDRFIYAKLSQEGLTPNPPADAAALVRRLHFALTGLPPTVAQSQQWTTSIDSAPPQNRDRIVEALVDQLLASRQFGHRWGRHWMDWIRYAESHGSEGDPTIENAWMYRDYLIRALNDDVPMDQLIREHIAGDLLDRPRIHPDDRFNESIIGTAHWRMVFHGFAPTDALDERVRFTDDQINAFSKAFLGLTVSCARCHDHKFDAISQADYYALYGVLASCRPGRAVIDLPEDQNRHRAELTELKQQIKSEVTRAWTESLGTISQRIHNKIANAGDNPPDDSLIGIYQQISQSLVADKKETPAIWQRLRETHQVDENNRDSTSHPSGVAGPVEDFSQWFRHGNGIAAGLTPPGQFALSIHDDTVIAEIYPAGIFSNLLSAKHAARLTSPNITLDGDYELWAHVIGDGGATVRYVVQNYPRSGTVYPVANLKPQWHWQRFDLQYWNGDDIHVELTAAMDAPLLVGQQPRSWLGVRDVRLVRKGEPKPVIKDQGLAAFFMSHAHPPTSIQSLETLIVDSILESIQAWQRNQANDQQALFLNRCLQEGLLVNRVADIPSVAATMRLYRQLESDIPIPRRVPSLDEATAIDQPLMIRGNHKSLGQPVPRRFLEAIDPTPYSTAHSEAAAGDGRAPSGRLRLAHDLLRDDNPLTSRVIANRVWHHLFGRGIVATPDNFGRLGEPPTHPELLDWLACRLRDNAWSIKQLVRLMVTSKTWQASTFPSTVALQSDPENRLWARARLNRLEAESVRDSILSVSGAIDLKESGPPVGGDAPRRSIYVQVRRNSLDPFLRAFDFPEPFSTTGRRDATNVPAQSLAMMNAPEIANAARSWARQVLDAADLDGDHQRIDHMFRAAFGRPAEAAEIGHVVAFLDDSKRLYANARTERERQMAQVDVANRTIEEIMSPTRARIIQDRRLRSESKPADSQIKETATSLPILQWNFANGINDSIDDHPLTLSGDARLHMGTLVFRGNGYASTGPLNLDLKTKTLEAWVELEDHNQRGAGVLTLQTLDGQTFDSIVFGEKSPGQWIAGSNHFLRTESFAGKVEGEATTGPIHLAIVYEENGRVTAYRNGEVYGNPYQSRGLQPFTRGQTILTLGIRHLPAGGNRMLRGKIHQAKLYNVALTAEEVRTNFEAESQWVSDSTVFEQLTDQQRAEVEGLRREIAIAQTAIKEFQDDRTHDETLAIWTDFAHSLFTSPEFIYIP